MGRAHIDIKPPHIALLLSASLAVSRFKLLTESYTIKAKLDVDDMAA